MKIQSKIFSGYIWLSLIFIIIGIMLIFQINSLNPIASELDERIKDFDNVITLTGLVSDIESLRFELMLARNNFRMTFDEIHQERYHSASEKINKSIDDTIKKLDNEFDQKIFEDLRETNEKLENIETEIFNLIRQNKLEEADILLIDEKYSDLFDQFSNLIDRFHNNRQSESSDMFSKLIQMSVSIHRNNQTFNDLSQIILISFVGVIISSVLLSFFISRWISRPIHTLKNAADEIANENYDVKISHQSKDELGILATQFDKMRQRIKNSKQELDKKIDEQTLEFKQQKDVLDYFKNVLDQSALVSITDKEGTITYVNKKFEEVSKYPKEELIGQNHRIIKSGHHPPEFFDGLWKTISSGKVWKADIKNRAKDGSYYWVKTVIVPFIGKDGKPEQYIAARTDITRQKENEEKLADAIKEIKKANVLKDEFATMVSHELKTPLSPIIGWCDALQDPDVLGTITTEQKKAVQTISSNAEKLERLIGDLLDIQKLELGRMVFEKVNFQVDEMMDNIKNSFEQTVKQKQIRLVSSVNEKINLISDIRRIEEVLSNMVYNAIDFVPKKDGRIELDAKNENGVVVFSVKDNGKGISKEAQESIFKKFYQTDTSLTRKHGGTGLGLSICKGIVEALGGKIWVESEKGIGSNFYFTIPKGSRQA